MITCSPRSDRLEVDFHHFSHTVSFLNGQFGVRSLSTGPGDGQQNLSSDSLVFATDVCFVFIERLLLVSVTSCG
jgi:hypothetical protein